MEWLALSTALVVGFLPAPTFELRYRPRLGDVFNYRLHIRFEMFIDKSIRPGPKDPKGLDQRAHVWVDMRQAVVAMDRASFTRQITFGKPKFESVGIFDEAREGMATYAFEPMTLRTDFRGRALNEGTKKPSPTKIGDLPYPERPLLIGDSWSVPGLPGSYTLWERGVRMGRPAFEISGLAPVPAGKGLGAYGESRLWIDAVTGFMLATSGRLLVRTADKSSLVISTDIIRVARRLRLTPVRKKG